MNLHKNEWRIKRSVKTKENRTMVNALQTICTFLSAAEDKSIEQLLSVENEQLREKMLEQLKIYEEDEVFEQYITNITSYKLPYSCDDSVYETMLDAFQKKHSTFVYTCDFKEHTERYHEYLQNKVENEQDWEDWEENGKVNYDQLSNYASTGDIEGFLEFDYQNSVDICNASLAIKILIGILTHDKIILEWTENKVRCISNWFDFRVARMLSEIVHLDVFNDKTFSYHSEFYNFTDSDFI